MKNPPSLTGLFNVGVIGFEPTTPCSQSGVLTVYLPMRDSNSDGITVPFVTIPVTINVLLKVAGEMSLFHKLIKKAPLFQKQHFFDLFKITGL